MIKQDICVFLSEFFLHFIIQFYILMSLPVLLSQWNLSEWIKAESYKQKPKFFSCLCYQAANISQKPSVYFAFVTIPVGKNVHKRSVCWLAVIGRAWRAEWRDSNGREREFSPESWKMLSLIQWFCTHLSPWCLQVSSQNPPTGTSARPVWVFPKCSLLEQIFSFFTCLPFLAGRI